MKNIRVFYLKKFSFLEVKLSIYLNRRVFVMQFSASQVVDINSLTEWHTVQIQISWLQKPTDLDLHCLQRQDISGFSRTRVKEILSVSLSSLYVFYYSSNELNNIESLYTFRLFYKVTRWTRGFRKYWTLKWCWTDCSAVETDLVPHNRGPFFHGEAPMIDFHLHYIRFQRLLFLLKTSVLVYLKLIHITKLILKTLQDIPCLS